MGDSQTGRQTLFEATAGPEQVGSVRLNADLAFELLPGRRAFLLLDFLHLSNLY